MAGRPLAEQRRGVQLSGADVDTLLRLNRLQDGLAPPVRQGWADYIEDCLWGQDHEWRVLAAMREPDVDAVLATGRGFLGRFRNPVFVRDDLVTGSFEPYNVLGDGETVTMVDLDAAGTGDRMIDLATLLRFDVDGTHREIILAEADRVGRLPAIRVARLYWLLSSLHLAVMSGQDPSQAATRTHERLENAFVD